MDNPRRRPAPAVRVIVLAAAIACLGLTMCHSERRATSPAPPAATSPAANEAEPVAQQPARSKRPPANPPAQAADPTYFPATKAAGPIR